MVNPAFDGLYEAFPVWVWAKQNEETSMPKIRKAPTRFMAILLDSLPQNPAGFGAGSHPQRVFYR
jgi:hypothetical protein